MKNIVKLKSARLTKTGAERVPKKRTITTSFAMHPCEVAVPEDCRDEDAAKDYFLDIAMCVGDIRTGDVLLNDGDKDWENWRRRRRRMRECGRRLHGRYIE